MTGRREDSGDVRGAIIEGISTSGEMWQLKSELLVVLSQRATLFVWPAWANRAIQVLYV